MPGLYWVHVQIVSGIDGRELDEPRAFTIEALNRSSAEAAGRAEAMDLPAFDRTKDPRVRLLKTVPAWDQRLAA
jgi:hypothetical protein